MRLLVSNVTYMTGDSDIKPRARRTGDRRVIETAIERINAALDERD